MRKSLINITISNTNRILLVSEFQLLGKFHHKNQISQIHYLKIYFTVISFNITMKYKSKGFADFVMHSVL